MKDEYRIVNTDNFGSDYPNESFADVGPFATEADAQTMADTLNGPISPYQPRYFKVVKMPYELRPGFEA